MLFSTHVIDITAAALLTPLGPWWGEAGSSLVPTPAHGVSSQQTQPPPLREGDSPSRLSGSLHLRPYTGALVFKTVMCNHPHRDLSLRHTQLQCPVRAWETLWEWGPYSPSGKGQLPWLLLVFVRRECKVLCNTS